jgi:hypothetical protein
VRDPLLAESPAEANGPAAQLGAEVGEAVAGLHLDPKLGEIAEDGEDLAADVGAGPLQPLHGWGSLEVHIEGIARGVARGGQLTLDGEQLGAKLADPLELLLQAGDERVGFPKREEPHVGGAVHAATVHDGGQGSRSAALVELGAMADELRELSDADCDAYFRGVQPIWGGGLSEERFVAFQRRLLDAREAAERYRLVGLFEGKRMLSAMKAYDLRGSCAAKGLRFLGIGAVFTPPALRRRGCARRMLELAIAAQAARGAEAAILFSDIGAAYYERLGFRVLRSEECSAEAADLPRGKPLLRPSAPEEAEVTRLLARGRPRDGELTLGRDGWVLRFQLRRLRELARARGTAEPEWGFGVRDGPGEGAAMMRLSRDAIDVLDAAWTTDAARDAILAGLRDALLRSGRARLRLWLSHQLLSLITSPSPRDS